VTFRRDGSTAPAAERPGPHVATLGDVLPLSRRSLFAGAGALALAACSSGSKSSKPLTLVSRFPNEPLLVPGTPRVAVSVVLDGTIQADGPATLAGRVLDSSGAKVLDVSAARRNTGTNTAYWAFRPALANPGIYTLRVDGDDGAGQSFQISDPNDVTMPHTGGILAPFDTPTVADHRGVEPYCSLTPSPCPLHDITLAQALQAGQPLVYMVGTPAHCQTGACAPALELLVAAHQRVGAAVTMVHADVYSNNAGTTLAPAVNALGISYEPVLYLCAADGTIVDHLDGIWDQTELDESLAKLTA
jgi:hypothetical protein